MHPTYTAHPVRLIWLINYNWNKKLRKRKVFNWLKKFNGNEYTVRELYHRHRFNLTNHVWRQLCELCKNTQSTSKHTQSLSNSNLILGTTPKREKGIIVEFPNEHILRLCIYWFQTIIVNFRNRRLHLKYIWNYMLRSNCANTTVLGLVIL